MGEWSNHAVALSHHLLQQVVSDGDYVCDATAGNGKDTHFLAKLVGDNGKVFAVDIQASAIESTRERLISSDLIERVELYCRDHADLNLFLNTPLKAVTFNLGYLPGGDHNIITTSGKTLASLEQSMGLLLPGGIISVVAYVGHAGGQKESEEIQKFMVGLSQQEWDMMQCTYPNQRSTPPFLMIIRKRDGR